MRMRKICECGIIFRAHFKLQRELWHIDARKYALKRTKCPLIHRRRSRPYTKSQWQFIWPIENTSS